MSEKTTKIIDKTTSSDMSTTVSEADVATALASNDPIELAKIQVRLQMATFATLSKIDWKLWEFYNRLGK
jgi:hypothetical protein